MSKFKDIRNLHMAVSEDISAIVPGGKREIVMDERSELRLLLVAAFHALRSYEFGNASPNLANGIADRIEAKLADIEVPE